MNILRNRSLRAILAMLCTLCCVLPLSACDRSDGKKVIRIGIKFDQPGLGFKKAGTYVGFDVDVAKYVAKKLGYSEDQIVWKESPSKQRETMLQNGDVDIIVATYSITDARKNIVSFAGPYFIAGQDLLVRKDEHKVSGPNDLNGKRLCSVSGSTSAIAIKEKFASKDSLCNSQVMQNVQPHCSLALWMP